MKIIVLANDAGEIVGSVVPSRGPVTRSKEQPVLATEHHPVLDSVESEDGHVVLEVTAPKELVDREPGAVYVKILRRYRVKGGKLVRKRR